MLKVNNKDNRRRSGVFTINFEHISHLFLVFLELTLSRLISAGQNTIMIMCSSETSLIILLDGNENISLQSEVHGTSKDDSANANFSAHF